MISRLIIFRMVMYHTNVLKKINTHILLTFSNDQLNAQFLYSSTIRMLHYDPKHVSSSTLLTSGGQMVSSQPLVSSPSVNSCTVRRWRADCQSALHLHTVRLFAEGDDTRGCGDTICPPEDE